MVVGETATGTTDIRPNPLDNGLRGVELNLEMLANLLHLDPPRPVPLWMQWLLILLAAGLPLWLYTALPPARATAGSLAVLGGVIAALEGGFWLGNLNTPYQASAPLVAVVGATLAMGVMRAAAEHAQKQKFRERFSQYVSPKLIAQIERNPDLTAEEGKRQRIAVLFSDVRGFTTYSEYNPPELVVRQMREYLDEMAAAVDQFDGVLDKFIGDAVMALYGPFMEQPDKRNLSALAVASALNMLQRLERVNARWGEEGLPLFRIGIGIHVGDAMVGEIGTPRRQQLTALGDTVNLAARLESSTKDLQATIIVSDAVRQEAEPVLREVATFTERGAISVKGREQPVRVFEVRPVTAAGLAPPVHH